jgi:hypothetical protein
MIVNEIRNKIATDDRWLQRGIIAIWKYQTATEKATKTTHLFNNVGFNGVDAPFLSSLAEFLSKGYNLSDKQKFVARKKMMKYSGQLYRIALGKQTVAPSDPTPKNIRGY